MTSAVVDLLPDVHASGDDRGVALDAVGVAGLALPVVVGGPAGNEQASVAGAELSVALTAETRGTHMSRFVEETAALGLVTPASILDLTASLCRRLEAPSGAATFRFPLFIERGAPITGMAAPHRYHAWIAVAVDA